MNCYIYTFWGRASKILAVQVKIQVSLWHNLRFWPRQGNFEDKQFIEYHWKQPSDWKGTLIWLYIGFRTEPLGVMRYSYQSEWPEKTDSGQTKLQKTQCYYDAVEDIPAFLKVHVRVQRNDLEYHFCCKDGYENLQAKRQFKLFKWTTTK